ncbi:MAG: TAXI family TRAP transporter solute-binding subunit [Candidatus Binatia bacterium]
MPLRIGTSELGGTFYSQAIAIAELFNLDRPDAEKCVVDPTDASIDNANRLDKGEIEFGFMASNWIGRARDGTAPFTRKIELRMVSPANGGPIFFVTLAGSPIKTVADFRSRRIALGPSGSGMVQHTEAIFNALGIPLDSFTPVYLGFSEGAEALIAGHIDAQFHPPIPNRVITDLSNRADIRVVAYASGQLERILSQVPFYRKITIEKGVFRGVVEDVSQVAVVNVIVTHERVAEEAVRDMARTIADNLHKLPGMNPLFKGLADLFEPLRSHGAASFEFGGVPLHPGALQAYREAGWIK